MKKGKSGSSGKEKVTGKGTIGKGRAMPIGGGSAAGIQKGVKKGGY